jgi:hypothetical protein
MDGLKFNKDGIEFQISDFEFDFNNSGDLIARHTDTGNTLTFGSDGSITGSDIEATSTLTDPSGTNHTGQLADSSDLYTDEEAEDVVAAILGGGDKVSVSYDDAGDVLTVDTSALDAEEVEDRISSLVASDSNLSWSYDDVGDALTISLSDSISVGTLEATDTTTDTLNQASIANAASDKIFVTDGDGTLSIVDKPSKSVEASTTNDGSDITYYSTSGEFEDITLLNLSTSGTMTNGFVAARGGSGSVNVDITVDGGTTFNINKSEYQDSAGDSHALLHIPPIKFDTSLQVDIKAGSAANYAAQAVVVS